MLKQKTVFGLFYRREVWAGLTRWSMRKQRLNAPWRVYLHRLTEDSLFHDHPWSWLLSIRLAGRYTEHRLVTTINGRPVYTVHRQPRIGLLRGATVHKVVHCDDDRPCWTLCLVGPSRASAAPSDAG